MRKTNKAFGLFLCSLMMGSMMPMQAVSSVLAETVAPHNYEVEIVAKEGDTSYFSNNEKLKKGENFTLEYTVTDVENVDVSASYRYLTVIGFDSLSRMYPDPKLCDVSNVTVDGNIVSKASYPNLPEAYFTEDTTYVVAFSTTDGGENYRWTAKCNGTVLATGKLPYNPYYGICTYGYGYTLQMTNVKYYTATEDLGVYAYNYGSAVYSAKVKDLDEKGDGRSFTAEDYVVENAQATLKNKGYLTSNAIEVIPTEETTKVYLTLPEIADMDAHSNVHVAFRLHIAGTLGTYDDLVLSTWGGTQVDYAYPRDTWNYVNFDTQLFKKNGQNAILVQFNKALGETLSISDIVVNNNTFALDNLLGGIELYQMENLGAQMESYLMLTPEGHVVVMDCGDVADTDGFVKMLRQFTNKVDAWFVSHFHCDHIGALMTMLERYDVTIDNLYYDFRGANNPGFTGDGDNPYIDKVNQIPTNYPDKVKNLIVTKKGDVFTYGSLTMKVLNDGYFGPGSNQGNDTTVVYKMETPNESVLFLGDLGARGDAYLKETEFVNEIRTCRIVQMAHHGQNGVSDSFYKTIDDIRVCLYPAPRWLYDVILDADYENQPIGSGPWGTLKTRNLMREMGVRANYTSIERVKLT